MNGPEQPQPQLRRAAMPIEAWAGPPLGRWLRLRRRAAPPSVPGGDRRPFMWRRFALLLLVLVGAWIGTGAMAEVLPQHGTTWLEIGLLALFGVLFAWISAGFWTGVLGAFVMLRQGGRRRPAMSVGTAGVGGLPADAAVRTAIVMPICNEHVPTVFGGLQATIASLREAGEAARFDVYVLSDTSDPEIRVAEQAAWSELSLQAGGAAAEGLRVHYRWRRHRVRRKAGNVADFCRRWGAAYEYFVVMDADSVMTGDCLLSLVRAMEASPDAGIIQTAPRAVGHHTFHARVQQFCARAYGPLFTAGMRYWQLGESHYWGHNAILRMRPFMAHCALPALPGDGSLSGDILSHDFVEAALMRRAGWKVWVADDIEGSYEQVPPNLLAELQRDRRWCQGNLQNLRLVFEPGLHPVHRTAFVTGVLAYASSPLWLFFLLLSSLLFALHAGTDPTYFVEPRQLFPIWPTANVGLMLTLFGLTGVLLLAPKVLSLAVIIWRGEARRFGGPLRLLASALIEFVHSVLLAPVRMLFHTQFVVGALAGWRLDWKSPPRDEATTSWREAAQRHGLHTLLAAVWIAGLLFASAVFPWWLSPILIGLLAAMPLSVLGSRVDIARALQRRGLLLTPEERRTPAVLRAAAEAATGIAARQVGFAAALSDPELAAQVAAAVPSRPAAIGAKARAHDALLGRACRDGVAALSAADRLRLLDDANLWAALVDEVSARRAPVSWRRPPVAADDVARQRAPAPLRPPSPSLIPAVPLA